MNTELKEFFSLIGKAKKEKEDEFKSLVGEINIDSLFTQVKESVKEEKEKKKKKEKEIEKQVKALESWLYAEPLKIKKEEIIKEISVKQVELLSDQITEEEQIIETTEQEILQVEVDVKKESTVDNALKILEQIKSKEEVQENIKDPEIAKIRKELEYLKNLISTQGGGGEVRLEFLDDIDRSTAKTNDFYLRYNSSLDKWVGAAVTSSGGGGTQTLDQTLGYGNTSNIGMSVGVVTATSFVGPLTGNATGLSGTPNINVGSIIASSATINGNVSIAGTLSYEDVTNVDSIGLITARTGIQVLAGGINVSGISTFNTVVVGGSTTSLIVNGDARITGILTIGTSSLTLDGSNNEFKIGVGVTIKETGGASFSEGINITGITTARSGIEIGTGGAISLVSLEAASSSTTTTSSTGIDTFDITKYRSAQYQIQITRGSLYHLTTLNVLHDGTDVYISEFGTIRTSESLASFDADINSGSVRILVTPTSNTSTTFKMSKVLTKI